MYVTITPNKVGGCENLINYLDKENESVKDFANYLEKENKILEEPELFFNGEDNKIDKFEVIEGVDGNCKGLSKNESRFFSLTINPSSKEIEHIDTLAHIEAMKIEASGVGEDFYKIKEDIAKDLYKEYTIRCMDNYAKNFNREDIKDNKDLVWYAKVEKERYWKYDSPEVKQNKKILREIARIEKKNPTLTEALKLKIQELKQSLIKESDIRKGGKDQVIKEMMPKSGRNYHIHVVVSRKDKTQKIKLSPLAKARNNKEHKVAVMEKNEKGEMVKVGERACQIGFDRNNFVKSNEMSFDKTFDYSRSWAETMEARKLAKEQPELYKETLKEKFKEERMKERGMDKEKYPKREREYSRSISDRVVNKVAHKAGLQYLSHMQPYYSIVRTGIRGISIIKDNPIKNEMARKLAISNYALLSRTTQNISKQILSKGIPKVNLYIKAIELVKSKISINNDREISY